MNQAARLPYSGSVALFSSILDFKKAFLSRLREKRSNPRFNVGATFPLKATLQLCGEARPTRKGDAETKPAGLSWSGKIGNISANGLSVLLPPAAQTVRGEETVIRLMIDKHELEVPCVIAHYRVFGAYSVCGVKLNFSDYNVQKGYHQLLEAVRIGTSFEPSRPSKLASGLLTQQWRSVNRATLTESRNPDTRKIERFELAVGEHRLAGQFSPRAISITPRSTASRAPIPASTAVEVRDFIRWVSANLPKAVPADLRDVIGNLTAPSQPAQGTWAPPPIAR